jgi:hypothetical protein
MASMVQAVLSLWISVFQSAAALFRSRRDQAIIELALRQQLAIYSRCHRRARIVPIDRAFWVALSRLWPHWKSVATISRYLPKASPDPGKQQRWTTFRRNHRDLIAGMDFFVVPTVRFHILYVWFAIDHGRRRILHFNVTQSPTACWVIQQLREAFPDEASHRFLIFDNDGIFSAEVARSVKRLGITPKRTSFQSPAGPSSTGLHLTPRWWLCCALVVSTIATAGEMRLDQSRGDRWSDTRSDRMNIDNAQASTIDMPGAMPLDGHFRGARSAHQRSRMNIENTQPCWPFCRLLMFTIAIAAKLANVRSSPRSRTIPTWERNSLQLCD